MQNWHYLVAPPLPIICICIRTVQAMFGTPRALTDALAAGGDEARRAFAAMMPMQKIDIATIEAARRG